jgi:hypothetical protein
MGVLGSSPFLWLEFDERGNIDPGSATQLATLLDKPEVEDLVVLSHGWKNDKRDAAELYGMLWRNVCSNFASGKPERIVVAGVLWPAKAFRTDFDEAAIMISDAGNTLAADAASPHTDLPEQEFDCLVAEFEEFLGSASATTIAAARTASKGLSAGAAHKLVNQGAAAVGINAKSPDVELARDAGPIASSQDTPTEAQLLLNKLSPPPQLKLAPSVGTAMDLGSAVQGAFLGARAAVARFLNQLTFYEMKKRAGVVGLGLVSGVLSEIGPARPIRLHLVGHSFGARLVTAAANQFTPSGNLQFFSLTMLQGAFSHNGLAKLVKADLPGAFPLVVGKPKGPITITHTHNDLACTLAYALASRLARDVASAIGDLQDEFGAMGANGPQKLEAGVAEPDDTSQVFKPKPAKVNTFLADAFIVKTAQTDAHNNITNPEVGRLVAATIAA